MLDRRDDATEPRQSHAILGLAIIELLAGNSSGLSIGEMATWGLKGTKGLYPSRACNDDHWSW